MEFRSEREYVRDTANSPDDAIFEDRLKNVTETEPEYAPEVTEDDEEILKQYSEHKANMEGHWSPIYDECEEDWDIYNLDQWTERGKVARKGRPIVTMDMCRKFVKSVVAETFRNPPGVKLNARRDSSSLKAQAIADAIRYFEDRSGAIYAYSFAKECAAVCGIGWVKVTYRYDEQEAMPAVIDVDRVNDPLSIMIDPDSMELDGADALFAMETHGAVKGKEKVTYWWKDSEGRVKWALICGPSIEDKGVWPGFDIPLVPVYGEITRIRSKTKVFGLIRQLRDTQRSYNYAMSEGIERLALTPKSPIVYAAGSISDRHKPDWQASATEPKPLLEYNSKHPVTGEDLPAPSRTMSEPDTQWLVPFTQILHMSAKETTGIFETSFGAGPAEMSGTAIQQKLDAGDRGHLVYDEHLQIAVKHVGRIMLDLLEPVVTPAGILPLMSEDGTRGTMSMTGQESIDPVTGLPMMTEPEVLDLDPTDLDISVSAAPAYATRKQEGLNSVMQMIERLPPEQAMSLIPQVIRDMDFPGSEKYANILSGGENPQVIAQQLQEAQAQLQQTSQQMSELQAQNMQLTMQLNHNTQAMLARAEIDSNTKIAVANLKGEQEMALAQMKIQFEAAKEDVELTSELDRAGNQIELDSARIALDAQRLAADTMAKNKQMQIQERQIIQQSIQQTSQQGE